MFYDRPVFSDTVKKFKAGIGILMLQGRPTLNQHRYILLHLFSKLQSQNFLTNGQVITEVIVWILGKCWRI